MKEYITVELDFTGRPGTNEAPALSFHCDGGFAYFKIGTEDTPNNLGGEQVALDDQSLSRLYFLLKSLREHKQ